MYVCVAVRNTVIIAWDSTFSLWRLWRALPFEMWTHVVQ